MTMRLENRLQTRIERDEWRKMRRASMGADLPEVITVKAGFFFILNFVWGLRQPPLYNILLRIGINHILP